MDKFPAMAFQRREDWQKPKTPEGSLCRQFLVLCATCSSIKVRTQSGPDEDGGFRVFLDCKSCGQRSELTLLQCVFKIKCTRCGSFDYTPLGDEDESGRFKMVIACQRCNLREEIPLR